MIAHLLFTIDYQEVKTRDVTLPAAPIAGRDYRRPPRESARYVTDKVAALIGDTA